MQWTKDKPNLPGLYWYCGEDFYDGSPTIIEGNSDKWYYIFGNDECFQESEFNGYWMGPIEIPEKP
jgi:hypothetical protein